MLSRQRRQEQSDPYLANAAPGVLLGARVHLCVRLALVALKRKPLAHRSTGRWVSKLIAVHSASNTVSSWVRCPLADQATAHLDLLAIALFAIVATQHHALGGKVSL